MYGGQVWTVSLLPEEHLHFCVFCRLYTEGRQRPFRGCQRRLNVFLYVPANAFVFKHQLHTLLLTTCTTTQKLCLTSMFQSILFKNPDRNIDRLWLPGITIGVLTSHQVTTAIGYIEFNWSLHEEKNKKLKIDNILITEINTWTPKSKSKTFSHNIGNECKSTVIRESGRFCWLQYFETKLFLIWPLLRLKLLISA